MSFALEFVKVKYIAELENAGIKVETSQNLLITDDKVVRLDPNMSSYGIERIVKNEINKSNEAKQNAIKRKQIDLFEEE